MDLVDLTGTVPPQRGASSLRDRPAEREIVMAPNFKMMALTMAMAFTSNQLLDSSNPSTLSCSAWLALSGLGD